MTQVKTDYLDIVSRLNRMGQLLQDTIEDEFLRLGVTELAPVQALILHGLGEQSLSPSDLQKLGIYSGTNPNYNIQKLRRMGYITAVKSDLNDRRRVILRITDKGREIQKIVDDLFARHAAGLDPAEANTLASLLASLDSHWQKSIRYLY